MTGERLPRLLALPLDDCGLVADDACGLAIDEPDDDAAVYLPAACVVALVALADPVIPFSVRHSAFGCTHALLELIRPELTRRRAPMLAAAEGVGVYERCGECGMMWSGGGGRVGAGR